MSTIRSENKIKWSMDYNQCGEGWLKVADSYCNFKDKNIIFAIGLMCERIDEAYNNPEMATVYQTASFYSYGASSRDFNPNEIIKFKLNLVKEYLEKHFSIKRKIVNQYFDCRTGEIEYVLDNGDVVKHGDKQNISLKEEYYILFYDMIDVIYKEGVYIVASLAPTDPFEDAKRSLDEKLKSDVFRRIKIENILDE
jgi:hypothetical protein